MNSDELRAKLSPKLDKICFLSTCKYKIVMHNFCTETDQLGWNLTSYQRMNAIESFVG